jgi:hypothetical protein
MCRGLGSLVAHLESDKVTIVILALGSFKTTPSVLSPLYRLRPML